MLFNSYEYIFAFVPVTVIVFLLLGTTSRSWALGWLIVASVFFYAWWRPFNLLIIGPSLVVNYILARTLLQLAADGSRSRTKALVLTVGIVFNLCLLGYFKYANFAVNVTNHVGGTDFVLENVILPLGISFITFQKIAFLIDVAGGRVKAFSLRDFLLFVMFFPQLIAGPIVHFGETMPQFHKASCRFEAHTYAAGLTLFFFGLFKKVVLADGIAAYVSPVYAFAAAGEPVTMLQAWLAAVGFTFQIYFDFSGYSDMACGIALLFGVRLPLNFDSPLRATNIIDFWLRWHVTLTRFLTAYVYNPITLALTRRRVASGKPILRGRQSSVGAFLFVLGGPTVITMLLSGVWHGAGYTFILWGLLHGLFLVINHAWRQYGPKLANPDGMKAQTVNFLSFVLCFLSVVAAMVLFRAVDVASAVNIFKGMVGLHGPGLPTMFADMLGLTGFAPMTLLEGAVRWQDFAKGVLFLAGLFLIATLMPNSLQILSKYEPVLQTPKQAPTVAWIGPAAYWRPTLPWMALIAVLVVVAVMRLAGKSEFLYWQF